MLERTHLAKTKFHLRPEALVVQGSTRTKRPKGTWRKWIPRAQPDRHREHVWLPKYYDMFVG